MKHFNLYHGMTRLNNSPLTEEEIDKILKSNHPIKKMENGKLKEIPINKIRVVKCTIV